MATKLGKKDWWGIAGVVVTLLTFLYLLTKSGSGTQTVVNGDGTTPDTYYLTGNQPAAGSSEYSPGNLSFGPINVGGGCGCTQANQATAAEVAAQTSANTALNNILGTLPGYLQVQLQPNSEYVSEGSY
jgi:hypothetical protein